MVDQAQKDMKESAYSYVVPSQTGKLVPSVELYPTLNKVKKGYLKAKNAITKSNANNKTTLLNDLNDLYNERITNGLIPYIDAAYNRDFVPVQHTILNCVLHRDVFLYSLYFDLEKIYLGRLTNYCAISIKIQGFTDKYSSFITK